MELAQRRTWFDTMARRAREQPGGIVCLVRRRRVARGDWCPLAARFLVDYRNGAMQRARIVRGRLVGPRRIELDEALDDVSGDVEVVVRRLEATPIPRRRLLEVIRALPEGDPSKEDIDDQIAAERACWGGA